MYDCKTVQACKQYKLLASLHVSLRGVTLCSVLAAKNVHNVTDLTQSATHALNQKHWLLFHAQRKQNNT